MEKSNTNQAIWVAIGSLSSVLTSLLTLMILSRALSKVDYGTYNQVMYVYNTLLIVFSAGLPNAFPYFLSRGEDRNAKHLISKINRILFVLGLFFTLALFFGSDLIAFALKNDELSKALKYFALVPMLMLPTIGLEGILSTFRKTKFLALFTIVTRLMCIIFVTTPVLVWNLGVESALIGFTAYSFIAFLLALFLKRYPTRTFPSEKTTFTYKDISVFAIPLMFAGIWGIIIRASDQFFISHFFGTTVFAEFANGSIELPFVTIFIGATTVVLNPVFSKKVHSSENAKEEVLLIWRSVFSRSVKVIYPIVIFCWFFAFEIIHILFGEKYLGSVDYFRIKLIVNLFTIISFGPLLLAIGATKYYQRVHLIGAIILIALEWLSVYTISSPYVITIISVVCQIGRIFAMLFFIAKYFDIPLMKLTPPKLQLEILVPSVLMLCLIKYMLTRFLVVDNQFLILLIGFVTFLLFFVAWVKFIKLDYSFLNNFYRFKKK
ncbi:Polysaccharide biosynthesis protein [compost metagenome]